MSLDSRRCVIYTSSEPCRPLPRFVQKKGRKPLKQLIYQLRRKTTPVNIPSSQLFSSPSGSCSISRLELQACFHSSCLHYMKGTLFTTKITLFVVIFQQNLDLREIAHSVLKIMCRGRKWAIFGGSASSSNIFTHLDMGSNPTDLLWGGGPYGPPM